MIEVKMRHDDIVDIINCNVLLGERIDDGA